MRTFLRFFYLLVIFQVQLTLKAQVPVLSSHPDAKATIFLDFDGHTVEGTSWNRTDQPIVCAGSGLTATQILHVFNRVAEDYRPFNINITTDSVKFMEAPADRRMRAIITKTSSWYGNTAGGVAFIGSFRSGDDTPCFIFSALFGYNLKKIAEAISHESGHTLGLYHQSQYDENCNKITDYYAGQGSGEIGWAPIMGVGYNRNFTLWGNGPSSLGCTKYQSDLDIISSSANGFGYREDDHGQSFDSSTQALFSNNRFAMEGVVERNGDEDLFHFGMPGRGRLQLNAVPYNVGTGNAGSNLDLQVTLYNASHQLLNIYNPGALLNSVADTILNPGLYYLKVEGKGNQYAPAYASLGSYSLNATIEPGDPLPVHRLELQGVQNGDKHQFNWIIAADEQVAQQTLELSVDGNDFVQLAETGIDARSYVYRPAPANNRQYRLRVDFVDGHHYYSNTVTILKEQANTGPKLVSNFIYSNTITVNSPGNFNYSISDLHGKIIRQGNLVSGINNITAVNLIGGLYIIRFWDQQQQWSGKLLRQ